MEGFMEGKVNQKKNFWNLKRTGYIFTAVMVALPLLDFLVFYCVVNAGSIVNAFVDGVNGGFTWDHFKAVFDSFSDQTSGDSLFVCLKNTMIYFGASFVTIPISILLTYFLYKRILGHNLFRIIFFLPGIIPGLVWVTAWKELTSYNGLLGQFMEMIGQPLITSIYKDAATTTTSLVFYGWWLGLASGMLYYFSAMSRIPVSVLEAAKLDGCGPFREFTSIVMPLVGPTMGTMIVLSFSGMLGASGPILLFISDGLAGISTLSFRIYHIMLQNPTGDIGFVSALGLVMSLFSFPIALLARYITNKAFPAYEY
jgi:ABC-type sugar transport system permease subunit